MSEAVPEVQFQAPAADAVETPAPTEEPAAAVPSPANPPANPLEALLGGLDEQARNVILGEVRKARNEANNLRTRLNEASPKLTEYDRLVEASKTDLERAQESEKAANGRVAALQDRLARAEIKAALTGVVPDVDGFLEDINIGRFIGDDGEVNTEAVQALRSKYQGAFAAPEKPGMKPNPSQGSSASPAPSVNDQIAQAQAAGDFRTAIRLKSAQALNTSDN